MVRCKVQAGDQTGVGYSDCNNAAALVAGEPGQKRLRERSSLFTPALVGQVQNDASRWIASLALSAFDVALWNLNA